MIVAANTHCFGDRPFEDAVQSLADLEYDKIELWLREGSGHLSPAEMAAQPEKFAIKYRELTRMTPIAFHLEEDPGATVFEGLCRLGKLLKVTQFTIPAGVLGTPFNEEIDRLRSRLAVANHGGLKLSLKTQQGRLTEDPQTAVELCQAVPGLGLTLDPSHYICGKYAGKSFENVYPYMYHTHVRDTSATDLQVPVGLGEVDYSRIIAQARRFNFCKVLAVEILPEKLGDSDRALELRKIRLLLESLL